MFARAAARVSVSSFAPPIILLCVMRPRAMTASIPHFPQQPFRALSQVAVVESKE
jgi:hypothetical protein